MAVAVLLVGSLAAQKETLHSGYPIDPVPFTSVKVTDSFWGQRLKASREVTIPLAFSKCEETGRYENFVRAAHPSDSRLMIRMFIRRLKVLATSCKPIRTRNWRNILTVFYRL